MLAVCVLRSYATFLTALRRDRHNALAFVLSHFLYLLRLLQWRGSADSSPHSVMGCVVMRQYDRTQPMTECQRLSWVVLRSFFQRTIQMDTISKLQRTLDLLAWLVKTVVQIIIWILVLWLIISRWTEIAQLPLESILALVGTILELF